MTRRRVGCACIRPPAASGLRPSATSGRTPAPYAYRGDARLVLRTSLAGNVDRRQEASELRALKAENPRLERELWRKDKALAEAAALLVLQKKYRALLGGEVE